MTEPSNGFRTSIFFDRSTHSPAMKHFKEELPNVQSAILRNPLPPPHHWLDDAITQHAVHVQVG
jgi:hypothetical protein